MNNHSEQLAPQPAERRSSAQTEADYPSIFDKSNMPRERVIPYPAQMAWEETKDVWRKVFGPSPREQQVQDAAMLTALKLRQDIDVYSP